MHLIDPQVFQIGKLLYNPLKCPLILYLRRRVLRKSSYMQTVRHDTVIGQAKRHIPLPVIFFFRKQRMEHPVFLVFFSPVFPSGKMPSIRVFTQNTIEKISIGKPPKISFQGNIPYIANLIFRQQGNGLYRFCFSLFKENQTAAFFHRSNGKMHTVFCFHCSHRVDLRFFLPLSQSLHVFSLPDYFWAAICSARLLKYIQRSIFSSRILSVFSFSSINSWSLL